MLTVAQVLSLADLVGRRPIGNIRRLHAGDYRVRYRRAGQMQTSPQVHTSRADAEAELANCTLIAREPAERMSGSRTWRRWTLVTWGFVWSG